MAGSPEGELPPADAPGLRQLGDYRIIRELGRGGMGVVYEAEQLSLGRHVALKVPPSQALLDETFLERFRCEARAAARLHHPNIVPVFGVGEHGGVHYYAMQFIEGRNLDSVIEDLSLLGGRAPGSRGGGSAGGGDGRPEGLEPGIRPPATSTVLLSLCREPTPSAERGTGGDGGPPPGGAPGSERPLPRAGTGGGGEMKGGGGASGSPPRTGSGEFAAPAFEDRTYFRHVGRLGRQVADALAYAHGEGILHRDIKPANLLLDGRGTIWVTDFGLAKANDSQGLTRSGDVVGTLAYMAPERFSGWSSPQGDIYALGLTLYELLTLVPAFRDTDPSRLVRRIKEEEPPRPRKLRRRVPRDLETIVLKAMAKEPARRYASAGEMAEDLGRFLSDQAIRARPPSSTYLMKVFVKRNRVAFFTAAAVVLLLGLAAFGSGRFLSARRFEENLAMGRSRIERFQVLQGRIAALSGKWSALRAEHRSWEPVWEREDELEAWQDLQEARRGIDRSYQQAVLAFSKALEDAPLGSGRRREALRALEDSFWERYQEASGLGAVLIRPEEYKVMIQSLGLGTYSEELERGSVAFESDPPGADVLCYRYEEYEAHLVPIPFDPRRGMGDFGAGLLGDPLLEIEAVGRPDLGRFRAGDRFLKIGERALHLEGDLARALRGVKAGEEVQVEVLRGGKGETVRWVPFPEPPAQGAEGALRPGRLVSAREQFGFTFAGYPLLDVPGCHVGMTRAGSPLELKLPEGSYLFVFRKVGHRDARFPVAVPRKGPLRETVRLLREDEIPEGFVWIPAGPFSSGGDPEAFQSLPRGDQRLEGFFIARHETTFREYLEFLNDRAVPEGGEDSPNSPEVAEEVSKVKSAKGKVRLVPVNERDGKPIVTRTPEGRWVLPASRVLTLDSPVFGVPQLAAQEYAAWLTRAKGGGFKFRLPGDLEWEKAARGADRRTFVWGSYPIWSFSWSNKGLYRESKTPPGSVGISPLDESVFGVRDLAGSVSEHTSGRTQPEQGYRYTSIRGGNFYNTDDFWFRIATRNGILPENSGVNTGLRLAAEPAKRD